MDRKKCCLKVRLTWWSSGTAIVLIIDLSIFILHSQRALSTTVAERKSSGGALQRRQGCSCCVRRRGGRGGHPVEQELA